MRKMWMNLILFLLSVPAVAQYRVNGKVTDDKRQPLDGITISLYRSQDSSLSKFSVSNKEGIFELDKLNEGKYFIKISGVGFEEKSSGQFVLDANHPEEKMEAISLVPASSSLNAVTIVAKRPMIEVKADRTLVNVDASPSNVGANALEVLEKSPGVSVDRDGNISLKGRQGVLVMMDGKPTYLAPADLASLLKSMNANQLDQIEIMTNPPAKYDAAGNSGVINIKTKKNKAKGFNGNVSLSYGQGAYWKTNNSLNLNYRNNKFNAFMNLSMNANKGFGDLNIERTYYDTDGKTITSVFHQPTFMRHYGRNASLKFGMDYNLTKKSTIGVVFNGLYNPRQFNTLSTGYLKDATGVVDSTAQTIGLDKGTFQNGSVNLNFKHVFSSSEEITADVDVVKYDNSTTQEFHNSITYPDRPVLNNDKLKGNLPSKISIYSVKTDYTKTLKSGWKVEAGLKSSLVKTDNLADYYVDYGTGYENDYTKTNHFLYEENINAVYGNTNKQLGKWNVQAGLRLENTNYKGHQLGNPTKDDSSFNRQYTSLFPTLYVSYQLDSNNTITVNTGRRIDRPAYRQLNPFLFFINKFTYAAGNPFLQPQYTTNFEIAHSYKGKLNTSLTYGRTTGLMEQIFRPEGEVTILTDGNLGTQENFGLGVNTQINPVSWWNISANANLNYLIIDGNAYGQSINTKSFNGQFNLNNQFNFKKGWGAELSGWYNTRNKNGQFDIQGFGQMSIGLSKNILDGKGSIKMNMRDVFWTQRIDGHIKYGNVDEHFKQFGESRVFNISFNYRFGKQLQGGPQKKNGGVSEEQRRAG
jgi:iron complex outermembrane recepter protein